MSASGKKNKNYKENTKIVHDVKNTKSTKKSENTRETRKQNKLEILSDVKKINHMIDSESESESEDESIDYKNFIVEPINISF